MNQFTGVSSTFLNVKRYSQDLRDVKLRILARSPVGTVVAVVDEER